MNKLKRIFILYLILISFQSFSQNLIPFERFGMWGYQDSIGNEWIEPKYQYAGKFRDEFATVVLNDSAGVINKKEEIIIPFKYEYLRYIGDGNFQFGYRATYFGEYQMGIITAAREILIEPKYRYVFEENQLFHVQYQIDSIMGKFGVNDVRSVKTKHGLFDKKGNEIIPCEFDYLFWLGDSLIVLRKGLNHALYSRNGKPLTAFNYKVIGEFIEGVSKVKEGKKYGFIFPNGQIAIPIQFDMCYPFKNEIAMIKIGDGWGAINRKGESVIVPNLTYKEAKEAIENINR